jgi:hypothetical protein
VQIIFLAKAPELNGRGNDARSIRFWRLVFCKVKEGGSVMTTCLEKEMKKTPDEALILGLLRREGSATIEDLMALSRMSWEQVFGLIDRLGRCGSIRLTRVGREYYVERMGTA